MLFTVVVFVESVLLIYANAANTRAAVASTTDKTTRQHTIQRSLWVLAPEPRIDKIGGLPRAFRVAKVMENLEF